MACPKTPGCSKAYMLFNFIFVLFFFVVTPCPAVAVQDCAE